MDETIGLLKRCTFPEATTKVTCALSGGADSTALVFLAIAAGCTVDAVHIHHGLRTSADDDAVVPVDPVVSETVSDSSSPPHAANIRIRASSIPGNRNFLISCLQFNFAAVGD